MSLEAAVIAYVPVLHRGYIDFFRKIASPNTELLLLERWFAEYDELRYFRKDIRCMDADDVALALEPFGLFPSIGVIRSEREFLDCSAVRVVMPLNHITDVLRGLYPEWFTARSVTLESSFLMWDRRNIARPDAIVPDRSIVAEGNEARWMRLAFEEKAKSDDWWIRVGAVAVRGLPLLAAHNVHAPNTEETSFVGDPRFAFHRGEYIYLTSANHAEAALIGQSSREGIPLAGADLYVTTFPCPPCAHLIATTGIRRLFFASGYSLIHAAAVLRARGVEIIQVLGLQ